MSNRPIRPSGKSRKGQAEGQDHTELVIEQLQAFYKKWILPYSKVIAAAVIVILGIVLVLQGMQASHVETEGKAFAAMSEAEDADAYIEVASSHPESAAAPRAYLQAGRALYDEGKYEQAATKLALARKGAAGTDLEPVAALGEAYALEAAGKIDVAEARFREIADSATIDALAVDAWLGAGRCAQMQGMHIEAEKLYNRAKELIGEDRFALQRVENALTALKTARYAKAPAPQEDETAAPDGTTEDTGDVEKIDTDTGTDSDEK